MTERRRFKRFPIAYPVECGNGAGKKTVSLVNVSENGLAFTSPTRIGESETLDLHIFLKNRMFNLEAVVVYASQGKKKNQYNIGTRFLNIPENFRRILSQEAEDIMQFCRESNLYRNKNFSLRKASMKYLKDFLSF